MEIYSFLIALARRRSSGDAEFLIFIVPIIVVIFIAIIVWSFIYEQKRNKKMGEIATSLKLKFHLGDGFFNLITELSSVLHLFTLGSSKRISNMMEDVIGDMYVRIFDYSYTTGSGKNRSTTSKTVLLIESEEFNLPGFNMTPENFLSKLGSMLGFRDINFETHPDFSKKYYLKGEDEESIRRVFKKDILEHYEQLTEVLCTEGRGKYLLFYKTNVNRLDPEEIPNLLGDGLKVAELFRGNR